MSPNINTITFGVEVECVLPTSHTLRVGSYHNGIPMPTEYRHNGQTLICPQFLGKTAKCERDSSLNARSGYTGVEFVSPVLKGEKGRQFILDLFTFIKAIGGKVNRSCGQHIHLGLESITGATATPSEVTMFLTQLIKISSNLQYAGYAQTGTARQINGYSRELRETDSILRVMTQKLNQRTKKHGVGSSFNQGDVRDVTNTSARGSFVNLTTIHRKATIEFRWGAGTLNPLKFLSHLFTCEYIARRAWRAKGYPTTCTKHRGNHIHRGEESTKGQRSLIYLVNDFRKNQDGRMMFDNSVIFKNNFKKMWKTSMVMARKWDRNRTGNVVHVDYSKDPLQAMVDKVNNSNSTWF